MVKKSFLGAIFSHYSYCCENIRPLHVISTDVPKHFDSVQDEFTAQKDIHHVDLENYVDQISEFHQNVFSGIKIIFS